MEKGITLVALVITIIVLLILAGVTLNLTFNGGLINKSQTAVNTYKIQEYKERITTIVVDERLNKIIKNKEDSLRTLVVAKLRTEIEWVAKVKINGLEENEIKLR